MSQMHGEARKMWRLFITLYLSLALFTSAFVLLSNELLPLIVDEEITDENSKDIAGWLITLDAYIELSEQNQWQALFNNISRESNLPVSLLTEPEVEKIPQHIRASLENKRLSFINAGNYELLYSLKGNRGILRIGPLRNSVDEVEDLENIIDYIFMLMLAFVVLFWHLNLRRKLLRLEKTAVAWGDGHLSVRAPVRHNLRIGMLNDQFNKMAERLKILVNGNRQLTNAISHELRSPLARLRCEVDMIDQADSPETRRNHIDSMAEDITEIEILVDEILSFSHLENHSDIHLRPQLIGPCLSDLLPTWQREFSLNTHLNIRLNEVSGIEANIDNVLFTRAMNNLVRNASRYSKSIIEISVEEKRKAKTEVSTSPLSESGSSHSTNAVHIHIDDDGAGVDRSVRDRIFEPFFRIDQSRSRESGGYGLGLAIIRQIAHNHGGGVSVSTSPLGGARFTLTLTQSTNANIS